MSLIEVEAHVGGSAEQRTFPFPFPLALLWNYKVLTKLAAQSSRGIPSILGSFLEISL